MVLQKILQVILLKQVLHSDAFESRIQNDHRYESVFDDNVDSFYFLDFDRVHKSHTSVSLVTWLMFQVC